MDSSTEVLVELSPLLRVFKDGRIQRLMGTDVVPASVDPATGVQSKDVVINVESGVSARLYMPKSIDHKLLPLLVYFHGGAFLIETAFSPAYHTHLNNLVAEANIIIVSVDYRRAPEHPLPIAYQDSWAAVQWAASHSSRNGQEPWLNQYADFERVFFAGDSAGANIAHNMALRVGSENPPNGLNVEGIVLVHSYFWGIQALSGEVASPETRSFIEKLWLCAHPGSSGCDDPLINPSFDKNLGRVGCKRVLILVAEKDALKYRGLYYKELLEKSGWAGKIEVVETKDEDHVFHLFNPTTHNAVALLKSVASFINKGK